MTTLTANSFSRTLTPIDRKLLRWLDDDVPRFERYITLHPEAGDRIDQLIELGDELHQLLRRALTDAVAVPLDLTDRMTLAMKSDRDTGAGSLLMDLFSVGFGTFNLWMTPQ